jgi:hypothetical protein
MMKRCFTITALAAIATGIHTGYLFGGSGSKRKRRQGMSRSRDHRNSSTIPIQPWGIWPSLRRMPSARPVAESRL